LADDAPPVPPQEVATDPHDPSQSLRAFLSEWEMNDFLLLLVIENLRPTAALTPAERAWFSVVPETWRAEINPFVGAHLSVHEARVPFLLARMITLAVFAVIAFWVAWRAGAAGSAVEWLGAAFVTVAW